MQMLVYYDLVAYHNYGYFTIGGKEFVQVFVVWEDLNGNQKEEDFAIYTAKQWQNILKGKCILKKENVAQNIMVGDYYN